LVLITFAAIKIPAAEPKSDIRFSLKPNVCMLSGDEKECRDQIVATWKSSSVMSVCLYRERQGEPLHCWQNASFGTAEFPSMLSQTTAFELRERSTQKLIHSAVFNVVYAQKKYQRSRRNPWSFF
jgi:hypothetical protein